MKQKRLQTILTVILIFCLLAVTGCSVVQETAPREGSVQLEQIGAYSGEPYVVLHDNVPNFTTEDLVTESYETYSSLDALGRCGTAMANIGQDLMPTEPRGSIGQVKPSGWQTVKYDIVDGKYLYNRCHLIGYQLSGENANEQNLITGTRYMNVEGMLPFENLVADYVQETGNHVLYRVTPVFTGDNLLADGVQMEALSVEDEGAGICFNVFVYNVQAGVNIDYATGESSLAAAEEMAEPVGGEIRGNVNSKIYHCPGQANYDSMADSKNLVVFATEEEAIAAGYRKAKN